ncbi:hypothetical protein NLG42_20880 [Flavobacterium plurextorum]|uniref:hypothetical protein n=1 Tax=Flavobacterium TaxID=237 RepID=UPI00214DDCB2|nr:MULTISPECIES: hypothetical protein [Flavobacterium]UUW08546.1 hypothetical protein NLG42_20880 [Flavobacterium plurextorum]
MIKSVQKFITKPRNIFLLDGFGALLTAVLLFFALRNFNAFFVLSKDIFEYLSIIAFAFFIYSLACYFLVKQNWKSFLKTICIANILYCILTFGIIVYNSKSISIFGMAYFLGEIIIISGLIFLEIKTIRKQ